MVNLFHSVATNFPKNMDFLDLIFKKSLYDFIVAFEDDLEENVKNFTKDQTVRLIEAFYIMKTSKFIYILWKLESRALDHLKSFEHDDTARVLRSFSHMNNNNMFGSEKTYQMHEESVMKNMNKFTPRELSQIAYAYASRESGSIELHKQILEAMTS
jgi:hypothetical protein